MLRSMYSGVSGLRNHQIRLDVIGNNIANVNTIGFKSSSVTFQDVLSQTLRPASSAQGGRGGVNPLQVGMGMTLGSINTNHTQGSLQSTGKVTDLAIEGNGFFVLRSGNSTVYSRAGSFDLDENGNLVVPGTGMKVQGFVKDADGNERLGDITISAAASYPAQPTTRVNFANNLDSTAPGGTSFITTVDVFDSLGDLHTVEIKLTKQKIPTDSNTEANIWEWELVNPPVYENGVLVSQGGALEFAADGRLLNQTGTAIWFQPLAQRLVEWPSEDVTNDHLPVSKDDNSKDSWDIPYMGIDGTARKIEVKFDYITDNLYSWTATDGGQEIASGTYNKDAHRFSDDISYSAYSAADKLNINLRFDNVTCTAGETSLGAASRDGAPRGSLRSYSIDSSGNIIGEFTNGMLQSIGQIALARFDNPGGLQKAGGTAFIESNNSGIPQIGKAGTVGFGNLSPGAVEMSNVDLSLEFTDMIVTQRGLQANSRIITTSDEVLQEVVNLKR